MRIPIQPENILSGPACSGSYFWVHPQSYRGTIGLNRNCDQYPGWARWAIYEQRC